MMKRIVETQYHSYLLGPLPEGCKLCVRGEKLVLFITGVCSRDCFYCPISDEKKSKDVVYANEWNVGFSGGKLSEKELDIVVEEARLCDAKGAGITGGDPILVVERTAAAVRRLKKEFGEKFHVHLYTEPEDATEKKLKVLYAAGLDEIRFHPKVWDEKHWGRIKLAGKYDWSVGVEIPAIPGYEKDTKKLIDFLDGKISFLNINELELADAKSCRLLDMGYSAKSDESYGVAGSEETALELMEYAKEKGYSFSVHYCTCRLKDGVQMARRIKRRAKNVARKFDEVTSEGMLVRGAMYLRELKPDFSYRKIIRGLAGKDREDILRRLCTLREKAIAGLGVGPEDIEVDDVKLRLIASAELVEEHGEEIKGLGLIPAVVEEYPTRDGLEVDVEFL